MSIIVKTKTNVNICLCCINKISKLKPRCCPICHREFKGKGWEGMDAHWKTKHEDIASYKLFWDTLCSKHK